MFAINAVNSNAVISKGSRNGTIKDESCLTLSDYNIHIPDFLSEKKSKLQ